MCRVRFAFVLCRVCAASATSSWRSSGTSTDPNKKRNKRVRHTVTGIHHEARRASRSVERTRPPGSPRTWRDAERLKHELCHALSVGRWSRAATTATADTVTPQGAGTFFEQYVCTRKRDMCLHVLCRVSPFLIVFDENVRLSVCVQVKE